MDYQPSARLCITLPPDLLQQLEAAAKRRYTSRSDLVRQAFLEWMERHGTPELAPASSSSAGSTTPTQKPTVAPLHPTTKRPLPRYGEVAYKDLIEPGMSGEELMQLLLDYESNI